MTNATTDTIPALLALDPSCPDEAARLRIGIARLAGWTDIDNIVSGGIWGIPPGEYFGHTIPRFELSLDAALTLLPKANYFRLEFDIDVWNAMIAEDFDNDSHWNYCEGTAPTPSFAVCRAWLRYELARRETSATGIERDGGTSEGGEG